MSKYIVRRFDGAEPEEFDGLHEAQQRVDDLQRAGVQAAWYTLRRPIERGKVYRVKGEAGPGGCLVKVGRRSLITGSLSCQVVKAVPGKPAWQAGAKVSLQPFDLEDAQPDQG